MRSKMKSLLAMGILLAWTAVAWAGTTDTDSLDRVSVLMPRSQVVEILGAPHETDEMATGLTAEVYRMSDAESMVGAGLIYDDRERLAGQAFVFHGSLAWQIAELMKERDFQFLDEQESGVIRLSGKDDDTGHPLVVVISQQDDHTTVMTFEQGFYEKSVREPNP